MRKSNLTKKVSIESSFSAHDLAILFQSQFVNLDYWRIPSAWETAFSPLSWGAGIHPVPKKFNRKPTFPRLGVQQFIPPRQLFGLTKFSQGPQFKFPLPKASLDWEWENCFALGKLWDITNRFLFWLPGTCKSHQSKGCRHEYDLNMQRGSIFDSLSWPQENGNVVVSLPITLTNE